MKNPFKDILEHEKLPELIKGRVMKDINLINLTIDLADLFLIKNPSVFKTIFTEGQDTQREGKKSPENKKNINDQNNE
ncbi:hypothetical protein LZF95_15565 [Algoriphagus sp. AGSA1]|uniref:hypothetical protein n=1 Tax=Algoriphagus sp. AGSA1 TaxID=2907213 RepID=UPI001F38D3E1|nr:hypothetical protein [Algoriphagus sp. AGSA1]MCE7056100.1 hypothetical protein [Algoriphagus sp. AGSA1]